MCRLGGGCACGQNTLMGSILTITSGSTVVRRLAATGPEIPSAFVADTTNARVAAMAIIVTRVKGRALGGAPGG